MFISGIGFFTDAYDLFIIGVVMAMLKEEWHPTPLDVGLVTSTAPLASAVGALLFGRVADMLGQETDLWIRMSGSGDWRDCLGVVFEHYVAYRFPRHPRHRDWRRLSGERNHYERIRRQADPRNACNARFLHAGCRVDTRAAVSAGLLSTPLSHDILWRLLLSFGAIPALIVFHARRGIHETPRFLPAAGRHDEFQAASGDVMNQRNGQQSPAGGGNGEERAVSNDSFWEGFQKLVSNRKTLSWLIGASLAWFLMDFAYHGNTVSSPLVLAALAPHKSLLHHTLVQLLIFVVAPAPGYFVAAATMDKSGERPFRPWDSVSWAPPSQPWP